MAPRAQTEEAAAWFYAVFSAVQEVPHGKVTTYGHIARLLGRPECPRQVGVCLKHLPSATDQPNIPHHNANVPWQRIVNAKGSISPRGAGGAARQAAALRAEGVEVGRDAMGQYKIDLATHGWFPNRLPSDQGEDETSSDDDDGDDDDDDDADE